jgi:hypothetical protein
MSVSIVGPTIISRLGSRYGGSLIGLTTLGLPRRHIPRMTQSKFRIVLSSLAIRRFYSLSLYRSEYHSNLYRHDKHTLHYLDLRLARISHQHKAEGVPKGGVLLNFYTLGLRGHVNRSNQNERRIAGR